MKTLFNISAKIKNEKGVTLVYVALLLVVFLGMAALAVDVGYLMVSKNELQNAADAAALAGASYLYPQISPSSPSPPAWGTATTQATSAIGLNKSSGTALTDGTVQTGYWNLAHTPYGLQGTGITPGPQDCAAVQVAVSRSAGHNSGPVQHWFAPVLGINTSDSSAVATAAMCSPGTAFTGATMPFAISEAAAMGLAYYAPFDIEVDGVKLCTKNGISTQCGQWTTLLTDGSNSNSWIKDLIDGTNSSPERSIGDSINIVPGTRASDYKEVINTFLGRTSSCRLLNQIIPVSRTSLIPLEVSVRSSDLSAFTSRV